MLNIFKNFDKIEKFYDEILCYGLGKYPIQECNKGLVVVSHALDDATDFIRALQKIAKVVAIIPKTSQRLHPELINFWKGNEEWPVFEKLSRSILDDQNFTIKFLDQVRSSLDKFSIIDHGGYFTKNIQAIYDNDVLKKCCGIIDGTARGIKIYELAQKNPLHYFNHYTTYLKDYEMQFIASDTAKSLNLIFKAIDINDEQIKTIGIVGAGKTGHAILKSLSNKNCKLKRNTKFIIADTDVNQLKKVSEHQADLKTTNTRDIAINSDLIISCTGSKPWKSKDYGYMKDNVFLTSITSSKEELGVEGFFYPSEHQLSSKKVLNTDVSYCKTYQTHNSKKLNVLLDGLPANYLLSFQNLGICITHGAKLLNTIKSFSKYKTSTEMDSSDLKFLLKSHKSILEME